MFKRNLQVHVYEATFQDEEMFSFLVQACPTVNELIAQIAILYHNTHLKKTKKEKTKLPQI